MRFSIDPKVYAYATKSTRPVYARGQSNVLTRAYNRHLRHSFKTESFVIPYSTQDLFIRAEAQTNKL